MFRRILDPGEPGNDAQLPMRATIPMDRALLCIDCEAIFEATGSQTCPSCGSAAAWAIGRALNRTSADEESEQLTH
jgi:hypothetical protein